MKQWAESHEQRDDERFRAINAILAAVGIAFLAVTGWSLKTQYDSMQKQVEMANTQLAAIQTVQRQVEAMPEQLAVPKRR